MTGLKIGLPLLLLLPLIGCREEAPPPVSDGPAPGIGESLSPTSVNFVSQDLAESTRIGTIQKSFDPNDIMRVQVPIRAATDFDLTVDYRFTFLDGNHTVVYQPASWQTKTLHAGTFEVIDGVAHTPAARDFVLDLRYAR